jgi:hypothetical protein
MTNALTNLAKSFYNDNAGFVISSELILISTIAVLGLMVGMTEVASGVNHELEDVASAVGSINQSYTYWGFSGCKAVTSGSTFADMADVCDNQNDITCNGPIANEQAAY